MRTDCLLNLHRWNWDSCVLCGASKVEVERKVRASTFADACRVVRATEVELERLSAVGNDFWCRVFINSSGGVTLSAKVLAFRNGDGGPRRCAQGPWCTNVEAARAAILEAHEAATAKFEKMKKRSR